MHHFQNSGHAECYLHQGPPGDPGTDGLTEGIRGPAGWPGDQGIQGPPGMTCRPSRQFFTSLKHKSY